MKCEVCPTCNQSLKARWENLSSALVKVLKQFAEVSKGEPRNFNSCGFTFSQRANGQKLQYWRFIERVGKGEWRVTREGFNFLDGFLDVPKKLFVVSNKVERQSNEMVSFYKVILK